MQARDPGNLQAVGPGMICRLGAQVTCRLVVQAGVQVFYNLQAGVSVILQPEGCRFWYTTQPADWGSRYNLQAGGPDNLQAGVQV